MKAVEPLNMHDRKITICRNGSVPAVSSRAHHNEGISRSTLQPQQKLDQIRAQFGCQAHLPTNVSWRGNRLVQRTPRSPERGAVISFTPRLTAADPTPPRPLSQPQHAAPPPTLAILPACIACGPNRSNATLPTKSPASAAPRLPS